MAGLAAGNKVIIRRRFCMTAAMPEKKPFVRAPRDEYYLRIAYDVAARSTCLRRQIGAVIVTGDVIVSTGYNGNPRGMPHCDLIGCIRDELNIPSGERMEICTGVHAEMNALVFAGPAARGGALYCTIVPCNTCAKMIVNAGVKRVAYSEGYPDVMGFETLKQCGVQVDRIALKKSKAATKPEHGKEKLNPKLLKDIRRMKEELREKFAAASALEMKATQIMKRKRARGG